MRVVIIAIFMVFCFAAIPAQSGDNDAKFEIVFWESIKDSDDPQLFQTYLKKYPDGAFVEIAKIRIAKYGGSIQEPRKMEPVQATPRIAAPQPGSPIKIAIFPWEPVSGSYSSIILNLIVERIKRTPEFTLTASYYKIFGGNNVINIKEQLDKKDLRKEIWKKKNFFSTPRLQSSRVAQLGSQLGVDRVLLVTFETSEAGVLIWFDKVKIFSVDVHDQSVKSFNLENRTSIYHGDYEPVAKLVSEALK